MSGSAQAPSVPLNISPMVWLRQPAPISSACHGCDGWARKTGAAGGNSSKEAKFLENRTTIKAFSQTEEGVERMARRTRGERNNLHILENAAMHLRFISSRSKMDMRTRAGRKRRTRCLDQARPRAAVPPPCGFTNSDMLACEKRQLAGHNLHNYTRRRPSIFSRHTAAFFDSFHVRPALLLYGKRGFRAAIYKIARPQPPAAALWLHERIVPLVSLVPPSPVPQSLPII